MQGMTAPVVGNLGGAPQVHTTKTGKTVTRLRVACASQYRDKTGEIRERDALWVTCEAWGTLAERLADLSKGDPLVAVGEWRQSDWTDAEGNNRSSRFISLSAAGENLAIPIKDASTSADAEDAEDAEDAGDAEDGEDGEDGASKSQPEDTPDSDAEDEENPL